MKMEKKNFWHETLLITTLGIVFALFVTLVNMLWGFTLKFFIEDLFFNSFWCFGLVLLILFIRINPNAESIIYKELFGEGYNTMTLEERLWKAYDKSKYWLVDVIAWGLIVGWLSLNGKATLGLMIFAVYFGIYITCAILNLALEAVRVDEEPKTIAEKPQ